MSLRYSFLNIIQKSLRHNLILLTVARRLIIFIDLLVLFTIIIIYYYSTPIKYIEFIIFKKEFNKEIMFMILFYKINLEIQKDIGRYKRRRLQLYITVVLVYSNIYITIYG